jgi:hypothetical protein
MKNQLLFLLLLLFISCSKSDIQLSPNCQAVTYYIDSYDSNWKYIQTEVSIHWCNVCGEDLERFKSYEKLSQFCDETKFMRLVIGKDSCQVKL